MEAENDRNQEKRGRITRFGALHLFLRALDLDGNLDIGEMFLYEPRSVLVKSACFLG
jgi:hypothetical protein